MRQRLLGALFACALAGCHTAGANSLLGAAIMTPVAIGAGAVSRASGGCFAACPVGTVCNENTGLCERMPCRGFCPSDQRCDVPTDQCVPNESPVLGIGQEHEPVETKPPPVEWKPPQPLEPQPESQPPK
jgi:hypothetical protein